MKTFLPLVLLAGCFGCGPKSPYDVSADQIKKRVLPGGPPDLAHLPPGAVKHEKSFKKGETLPDGSIATGNEHIVTIEVSKAPLGRG